MKLDVISHCGGDLFSLMIYGVEHIFIYPLTTPISTLEKCVFIYLAHFKYGKYLILIYLNPYTFIFLSLISLFRTFNIMLNRIGDRSWFWRKSFQFLTDEILAVTFLYMLLICWERFFSSLYSSFYHESVGFLPFFLLYILRGSWDLFYYFLLIGCITLILIC
jgi:hypothetical protein